MPGPKSSGPPLNPVTRLWSPGYNPGPRAPGDPGYWTIPEETLTQFQNNPNALALIKKASQQLSSAQSAYEGAVKNNRVWEWGGSSADAEHWARVASQYIERNKAINTNLKEGLSRMEELAASSPTGISDPLQKKLADAYAAGDPIQIQGINELVLEQQQRNEQNKQLQTYKNALETQTFGGTGLSLEQALKAPGGDLASLSSALTKQQSDIFNRELRPEIAMQLGSQGLADSGAAVELQSKALGRLEAGRQENLLNAALGARSQINSLGYQNMQQDIGYQQGTLSNLFDLQRSGITMNFQTQLEKMRADLARELRTQYRGPSDLQQALGYGGAVASLAMAPYTRGATAVAIPGFLNYASQGGYR